MVIVDSGFWVALVDKRDAWHKRAVSAFGKLDEELITTWPVVTETAHLLLSRLSQHVAARFIEGLAADEFTVFDLLPEHVVRIAKLMRKYVDLPMDVADASLIVLAEHLDHGRILSTDQRDFKTYKWKNNKPFANLLLISSDY